ncbi:Na+/H+ antiporter nhaA (plasmid) [Roseomonas mucosa]|jgi:NhaA family Na+:H+ antiporter|uniref:Na(+)/H(+) antiporter NhaA n=1 Tax=Roseomonas mucosa TaxID=207340 RepID=A0A379PPF5_9PROT|nr:MULTISPECIES: Na+/H+ antiporter NhaA [Roseomonas]PZP40914.1 MAG: Na+/H+ antiporter NhaA [Azospirillum brasilense]QDD92695.1 Na+/H+ antiporter nhaA [Roseomonas mucosa]QDD97254.1 Na+/H+ antiporter nhaA [Roseomonas mucosa]QDJ12016.1 Na+/H+ antiporter nhaA [Roseomonas mucosa]QET91563.1 Na+/H+ antiporter NhaA [Roseomonas mucosa]
MAQHYHAQPSALRRFLDGQSSAGLVLMAAAALALLIANSPLGPGYEALLHAYVGPLSLGHWINDGLMAVFFLLVGLEIKREVLDGQLSTWSRRALPGIAAAGGMAVPALVYLAFNSGPTAQGWAIPAATDIAFALGVISLLGKRVPASLRIFLTALAIIDDLGAVVIIALFYTAGISLPDLAGAAAVVVVLVAMNRLGVRRLTPYLLLGLLLWVLVLRSGIHATLAGVVLAFTIPLQGTPGRPDAERGSPLHRLEHALHLPVGFIIVPIFGLANAGVSFLGLPAEALAAPVTIGVGLGLLVGKVVGVLGFTLLAIRLGLADMPAYAGRLQMVGTALLCGIGFTMSLFITLLAFPGDPLLQAEAKVGILAGSFLSGLLGYALLRVAPQDWPGTPSRRVQRAPTERGTVA